MTNTNHVLMLVGEVHDWYSFRWPIEFLFKT
jgi:IS4 transposase